MPVFNINYDEKQVDDKLLTQFCSYVLDEGVKTYGNPREEMSLFTYPYGKNAFSSCGIELYILASRNLHASYGRDPNEQRSIWAQEMKEKIITFRQENNIMFSILVTSAIEDWLFEFIE
jgi:hypothetical protein